MMHSMHGLFLTCTQGSHLYSCNVHSIYIYTQSTTIVNQTPFWKQISPTYLEGQCLAHGGESPSTLVPCLLATTPPFDSYPFTPSHPISPITLFTTMTSAITSFFVRDNNYIKPKKVLILYNLWWHMDPTCLGERDAHHEDGLPPTPTHAMPLHMRVHGAWPGSLSREVTPNVLWEFSVHIIGVVFHSSNLIAIFTWVSLWNLCITCQLTSW
jgi:hypothetical protein